MENKKAELTGLRYNTPKPDFLTLFKQKKATMDKLSEQLFVNPPKDEAKKEMLAKMYIAARSSYLNLINKEENKAKLKELGNPQINAEPEWKLKGSFVNWRKLAMKEFATPTQLIEMMHKHKISGKEALAIRQGLTEDEKAELMSNNTRYKLAENEEYGNALSSMISRAYDWKSPKLRGQFGAAVRQFNDGDIPFDELTRIYNELEADMLVIRGVRLNYTENDMKRIRAMAEELMAAGEPWKSKVEKAVSAHDIHGLPLERLEDYLKKLKSEVGMEVKMGSYINWVKLAAKPKTASFVNWAKLERLATVTQRSDGWHVLSEEGKNLGGPYKSKSEAVKRLRQVEFYKAHPSKGVK